MRCNLGDEAGLDRLGFDAGSVIVLGNLGGLGLRGFGRVVFCTDLRIGSDGGDALHQVHDLGFALRVILGLGMDEIGYVLNGFGFLHLGLFGGGGRHAQGLRQDQPVVGGLRLWLRHGVRDHAGGTGGRTIRRTSVPCLGPDLFGYKFSD